MLGIPNMLPMDTYFVNRKDLGRPLILDVRLQFEALGSRGAINVRPIFFTSFAMYVF